MKSLLIKSSTTIGLIGLAFIVIALPVVIVRLAINPSLESFFSPDSNALIITRRILTIAAFTGGYWIFVRTVEKRRAKEMAFRPFTIGSFGLFGAGAIALPMLILFAIGAYSFSGFGSASAWAMIALVIFGAALLEEVLFRAVLFRIVFEKFGFGVALLLPSILFSCLHLFNDHWDGWLSIVSVLLLGFMWSLVYALTQNVWAAAAHHACWNFTIFASGLPLTGQAEWRASAPLQSEIAGSDLVTGGMSGPEVSVLTILWLVALVGGLLWISLKRNLDRKRA